MSQSQLHSPSQMSCLSPWHTRWRTDIDRPLWLTHQPCLSGFVVAYVVIRALHLCLLKGGVLSNRSDSGLYVCSKDVRRFISGCTVQFYKATEAGIWPTQLSCNKNPFNFVLPYTRTATLWLFYVHVLLMSLTCVVNLLFNTRLKTIPPRNILLINTTILSPFSDIFYWEYVKWPLTFDCGIHIRRNIQSRDLFMLQKNVHERNKSSSVVRLWADNELCSWEELEP